LALALKDDSCIFTELEDHLAAGAARRTRDVVAIYDGDGTDGQLGSFGALHRRKNRGTFGADGQPVRGVFNVAARKDLALFGKNGSADAKTGIAGIGAL